jgi:prepilin-type N-terminal cleavage/methylation domain-containing protein
MILQDKGFTMVELIITIFVLSIAVIGVYNAFSILVILASNTTDRLLGSYLAQEGVEIARNIRDANWINGADWDGVLSGCTGSCSGNYMSNDMGTSSACTGGCELDYTSTGTESLYPWPSGDNAGRNLYINSKGFYGYYNDANSTPTKFKRRVIVIPENANDRIAGDLLKIIVDVSWSEKASILNSDKTLGYANPWVNPWIIEGVVKGHRVVTEYLYNWY